MADDDRSLPAAVDTDVANVPSPGTDQGGQSLHDAMREAVPELRINADDDDRASPTHVARDDDSDLPEEAPPEELAKLSQSAKRRVSKLNKQRMKLAAEVQRLKALEPSAQAADQVTKYLKANDIGQDDFLMGLELMSAMRQGNFRKFYEGVMPYMKLCEEYLGISLPPDLQQQVAQGHMTTQAAAMYSRERMDKAMAQTNLVRQQAALNQHQQLSVTQQEQRRREVLANQVVATVNAWEADIARKDPNYAAKKTAVQNTMHSVMAEQGPPQSPEHGVQIAKEAYRRVNEQFRGWAAPQRKATNRIPSSTGRTAGVSPEPNSLLEAVRFAREGARL
jgi:hypothetical protein